MIKMLKLCKRNIEIGSKKILKRWNRNVEQWPSCRNRPVSSETRLGRFVLGPDQMPDSLSCWAFLSLSKKREKEKRQQQFSAGGRKAWAWQPGAPPATGSTVSPPLRAAASFSATPLSGRQGKCWSPTQPNAGAPPAAGPGREAGAAVQLLGASARRWVVFLFAPSLHMLAQPGTCILRGFDSAGDSGFAASVGQVSREYYCAFTRVNFHWPVLQRNRRNRFQ